MGNEPHTLIEDREIEGGFSVAVVHLQAQMNEPSHIEDNEEKDSHVLHLGHRTPGSCSPIRQDAQGRAGIHQWPRMFAMNNVDTR